MLQPPISSVSVAALEDGTAGRGRARKKTLTCMVPAGSGAVLRFWAPVSSLLLCFHWIATLPYTNKSPICSASSKGLLQSPDASSALPRGSSDGSSLLRCREGWEQCLGVCEGQGRTAGSLCVVGWQCYQGGTARTASVCVRAAFPSSPCAVAGGISASFQVSASPSPSAPCNQPHAQMAQPDSLLFISGFCLPVLFTALILMKREVGWEDPSPFQNQDHFP